MLDISIKGLQEAQRANLRAIQALQPSGALGEAIRYAARQAHRHAIHSTPWQTRALAASHRVEVDGLTGRIFIDPAARNPRSKTPPAEYGGYLHAQGMRPGLRGGIRAFYQYTVERYGPKIQQGAINMVLRGLR